MNDARNILLKAGFDTMNGPAFQKYLPLIIWSIVILVADQVTKEIIRRSLAEGESVSVIDGFFNIVFVWNRGGAFSFLAGIDSIWRAIFFKAASVVALIVIVFIYRDVEEDDKVMKSALILIFGGALGNLWDRFLYGKVTDFLDVYFGTYHWPAFNVADSCISVGVTLVIVKTVLDLSSGNVSDTPKK